MAHYSDVAALANNLPFRVKMEVTSGPLFDPGITMSDGSESPACFLLAGRSQWPSWSVPLLEHSRNVLMALTCLATTVPASAGKVSSHRQAMAESPEPPVDAVAMPVHRSMQPRRGAFELAQVPCHPTQTGCPVK